jgi:hypothetical protein
MLHNLHPFGLYPKNKKKMQKLYSYQYNIHSQLLDKKILQNVYKVATRKISNSYKHPYLTNLNAHNMIHQFQ